MFFIGCAILCAIVGVFFVVVGGLALRRALPGNSVFGLRLEQVRKSKETWDAAHQAAGPLWLIAGVAFLLAGALLSIPSWFALLPLIGGVLLLAFGSNLGAQTAILVDQQNSESSDGCSSGGGCCGGGAAAPEVDLAAVREAAKKS